MDPDSTHTSRGRLLAAGKMLFSRMGYEQTSTAAIAREAGSSESQLVRYFGGKSGLLEAIFNEAWSGLNDHLRTQIEEAEHGRDAILRVLKHFIEAFGQDHDIAFLFLFEGRRVRGADIILSKGFHQFSDVLSALVRRGQEDGSFRKDVNEFVITSAMLGCAEGMIRDRMIAEREKRPHPFENDAIHRVFEAMVQGLSGNRVPSHA
ncbi:MAG TPA: TetR/AcrR family transcriptional regulator [Thermoanaerobaculia bacterium]|nr:TetR/AcrR family transcriptional regulator [Thermoanaerobaculia bacterium]